MCDEKFSREPRSCFLTAEISMTEMFFTHINTRDTYKFYGTAGNFTGKRYNVSPCELTKLFDLAKCFLLGNGLAVNDDSGCSVYFLLTL